MLAGATALRTSCILLMAAAGALAQPESDVLLRHTFATSASGWSVIGANAGVRAADSALEFSYEVQPKQFSMAVLPAPPEIGRLRRLRFRVKTDHDTAVAVLLSEKKPGGGNYLATFSCTGGAWQTVELTPGDFSASDGPNDPVDADGKLDLDQVEGVGVVDLAEFFASQLDHPQVPVAIHRPTGPHKLLLSNFELLAGIAPSVRPALAIDSFDRGYLEWVTLGGMKLKLASAAENPLKTAALEASYEQSPGPLGIVVHRLSHLDLSPAGGIAFDIASKADATVVVSLELKDGRRFYQTIYPPPAQEVFHVSLKFSDFQGTGQLEASKLKSLALTDVSGAEGNTGPNTLWIGRVEGTR
jgi:hypothetical protein